MKNLRYLLIIAIIPLFAFQCEDRVDGGHKYIAFVNNSDETIYVSRTVGDKDTLFDCYFVQLKTLPQDTIYLKPMNNYWETDLSGKKKNIFCFVQYKNNLLTCNVSYLLKQ